MTFRVLCSKLSKQAVDNIKGFVHKEDDLVTQVSRRAGLMLPEAHEYGSFTRYVQRPRLERDHGCTGTFGGCFEIFRKEWGFSSVVEHRVDIA